MLKRTAFYIILLGLLVPTIATAQRSKLRNQPKYDNRPLHFGFCLGLNFYDFQIQPVADLSTIPGYYGMWSEASPGYSIGIVSNLRLSEHWDFRFIPTFTSTVRRIYFDIDDPFSGERGITEREVESSFIQFPFILKLKSDRINNHRWYVLSGIQYNIDLASDENVEDDTIFKIKRNNVAWEAGVGIDIYFEYFKSSTKMLLMPNCAFNCGENLKYSK